MNDSNIQYQNGPDTIKDSDTRYSEADQTAEICISRAHPHMDTSNLNITNCNNIPAQHANNSHGTQSDQYSGLTNYVMSESGWMAEPGLPAQINRLAVLDPVVDLNHDKTVLFNQEIESSMPVQIITATDHDVNGNTNEFLIDSNTVTDSDLTEQINQDTEPYLVINSNKVQQVPIDSNQDMELELTAPMNVETNSDLATVQINMEMESNLTVQRNIVSVSDLAEMESEISTQTNSRVHSESLVDLDKYFEPEIVDQHVEHDKITQLTSETQPTKPDWDVLHLNKDLIIGQTNSSSKEREIRVNLDTELPVEPTGDLSDMGQSELGVPHDRDIPVEQRDSSIEVRQSEVGVPLDRDVPVEQTSDSSEVGQSELGIALDREVPVEQTMKKIPAQIEETESGLAFLPDQLITADKGEDQVAVLPNELAMDQAAHMGEETECELPVSLNNKSVLEETNDMGKETEETMEQTADSSEVVEPELVVLSNKFPLETGEEKEVNVSDDSEHQLALHFNKEFITEPTVDICCEGVEPEIVVPHSDMFGAKQIHIVDMSGEVIQIKQEPVASELIANLSNEMTQDTVERGLALDELPNEATNEVVYQGSEIETQHEHVENENVNYEVRPSVFILDVDNTKVRIEVNMDVEAEPGTEQYSESDANHQQPGTQKYTEPDANHQQCLCYNKKHDETKTEVLPNLFENMPEIKHEEITDGESYGRMEILSDIKAEPLEYVEGEQYYELYDIGIKDDKSFVETVMEVKDEPVQKTETDPYACRICGKRFAWIRNIAKHMQTHSVTQGYIRRRKFTCNVCLDSFDSQDQLTVHLQLHTETVPHTCHGCGQKFTSQRSLEKHILNKVCIKNLMFKCDACSESFPKEYLLMMHIKTHTGSSKYVCDVCGQRFLSPNLTRHLQMHTGEGKFECETCGQRFVRFASLAVHNTHHQVQKHSVKKKHSINKKLPINKSKKHPTNKNNPVKKTKVTKKSRCIVCGKEFPRQHQVNFHMKIHKGKKKKYKCGRCDKEYEHVINLIKHTKDLNHMYSDGFKRSYKCIHCHREFSKKFTLEMHMEKQICMESNSVFEKKKYKCKLCGKEFAMQSAVKLHMETHRGKGEKYKCNYCDKEFTHSNHIVKHIKTHKREKHSENQAYDKGWTKSGDIKSTSFKSQYDKGGQLYYICKICGKIFQYKSQLNIHMESHCGEDTVKCKKCSNLFSNIDKLKRHMQQTHQQSLLQEHALRQTDQMADKLFKCLVCGMKFSSFNKCRLHHREHSVDKPYKCAVCHKRLSTKSAHTNHVQSHEWKDNKKETSSAAKHIAYTKAFQCDICQRQFKTKSAQISHIASHQGKPFKCEICSKELTSTVELQSHTNAHTTETLKCDICGKQLTTKSALTNHLKSHLGNEDIASSTESVCDTNSHTMERLFKCRVCGKQLTTKSVLTTHLKSHQSTKKAASATELKPRTDPVAKKPYQSDVRARQFHTKNACTNHSYAHKEIQLYRCGQCSRDFTSSEHLWGHMESHKVEKQFQCDISEQQFAFLKRLQAHANNTLK